GIYNGIEAFEPTPIQPNFWLVTCFPNKRAEPDGSFPLDEKPINFNYSLKQELTEHPPEEWRTTIFNDFERPVFQQVAVAGNLKDQFYEFGALYAAMAGRGTAVYGLFEQNFVAVDAYKTLVNLGYPANLTEPLFKPDYGIYQKG